jgi:hypothetical protein
VVPDVDHGVAYTWHWISTQSHELVVGCAGCSQQILFLYKPQSEHGGNLLVLLQWEELRQWGPMVETPSTPEKGCDQ